jgi:hypothetical protein
LERYEQIPDRWQVFISYKSQDEAIAERLQNTLELAGINAFRDQESMRGGKEWWDQIQRAIPRSRYFVLLMGKITHTSAVIEEEIKTAQAHNIPVIPILAGADLKDWKHHPELLDTHGLKIKPGQWTTFIKNLLNSVGSPLTSLQE